MRGCKPFSVDLTSDQSALPHYVPPPCQVACPIGTDVGSYVGLIWQGNKEGALEAITATNPLSGICGRVCDAPCEPACRRGNSDGPVAIRALKRYVLDALGPTFRPAAVKPTQDKAVAIIGAGPAGLTAAQDLALAGYKVDLYEAQSRAGGMAVWGIPDFRLPPSVVQDDISRILARCPGITLHLSAALGRNVGLVELTHSHDAVLLAIGAAAGRKLGIPGDDAPAVVDGISFLSRINGGDRPVMPKHIVVVGGGDVAMDACRTAKRLAGVERVTVIYRRGPEDIPARKYEREAAEAEGIEILYNVMPVAIEGKSDAAATLHCQRTEAGAPGRDGRRSFVAVGGSDFTIEAGLVIAAVGQKTVSAELAKYGLLDGDKIATDPANGQTRLEKVFAAGDAATGSSTIVQAMYQGHRAAYYILAALEGNARPVPYRTPYRTRAAALAQDARWEKLARAEPKFRGLKDGPFAEVEENFDAETAKAQAARCFRCDTETGSVDYSVHTREAIFALAKNGATPADFARITRARLAQHGADPAVGPATFDELVFLPANLTRLVIDPYREACKTVTEIGTLNLSHPALICGFEDAPETVRKALGTALAASGSAYVGCKAPLADVPWLQIVSAGEVSDTGAAAVVLKCAGPGEMPAARSGQMQALIITASNADRVVPFAVGNKADFLIVDGTGHLGGAWADLSGAPDISVLVRTVAMLRALKAEEAIPLIWFGGLRSGTDMAKAMALGARAGLFEVSAAIAAGGEIGSAGISFAQTEETAAADGLAAYLKAAVAEASMMARCTGKTNVQNLEPEDLRSISLRARTAAGIVMAGMRS